MRVHVTRSGGLAGLRAEATIDTGALDGVARAAIGQLLAAPPSSGPSEGAPRGADRFEYWVSIAGGPAHRLDEDALPAEAVAAIHEAFAARPGG